MHIEKTSLFVRELKGLVRKYPSIINALRQLETELQENPQKGESLGKGCYKIRVPISEKDGGKSGGARVVTCVRLLKDRIDLLTIYDKSEKDTIPKNELKILLKKYLE